MNLVSFTFTLLEFVEKVSRSGAGVCRKRLSQRRRGAEEELNMCALFVNSDYKTCYLSYKEKYDEYSLFQFTHEPLRSLRRCVMIFSENFSARVNLGGNS